jgi:hypothetical protein
MDGWMDEWIDGKMNVSMDRWMNGYESLSPTD